MPLQATRAISWFRARESSRDRAKNTSSAVRTGAKPTLAVDANDGWQWTATMVGKVM